MNLLNELITVHTSLLFVVLMTNMPNQLYSQFNENLFQIYVNLFKYLNYIETSRKTTFNVSLNKFY